MSTNLPQQNKHIAKLWFEAFNEHDLEKLLSLYDENAEHFSPKLKIRHPETKGLVTGKEALESTDYYESLPELVGRMKTINPQFIQNFVK